VKITCGREGTCCCRSNSGQRTCINQDQCKGDNKMCDQ
jgi:hypothetical protein